MKFSIVMTAFEPWLLLPRALACVGQQTHSVWEVIVAVDGPCPDGPDDPRRVIQSFRQHHPRHSIELLELPRAAGCFGNVGRNVALSRGTGDYVCWVNHDNLIAPDYLATHAENIRSQPGCISVVGIEYWTGGTCHGSFPRQLARSKIDLLNFSVPMDLARRVQAFGGNHQRVYAADWLTFADCRRHAPVVQSSRIVGCHF